MSIELLYFFLENSPPLHIRHRYLLFCDIGTLDNLWSFLYCSMTDNLLKETTEFRIIGIVEQSTQPWFLSTGKIIRLRVERQVVSDFYWLKTLYVPSVAQVTSVIGVSFGWIPRPQQILHSQLIPWPQQILRTQQYFPGVLPMMPWKYRSGGIGQSCASCFDAQTA